MPSGTHLRAELAGLAAIIMLAPWSCGGEQAPPGPGPAPVTVARAKLETVPVELHAIGRVEASSTVEVRALVDGALEQVHFEPGQRVTKGQLLFTIDPRPYRAALDQARATLSRDRALLANAELEFARYESLLDEDFVSREAYDERRANARSLEGTVKADEAAVESARLELEYCAIRSPISGRAGDVLVDAGNLIRAGGDSPMVVLLQIRPVEASFAVPEQYLDELRRRAAAEPIPVEARTRSSTGKASRGQLAFIDNTVDVNTGTILLEANFANDDERLWPGQFVDLVMVLSVQQDAIVVPNEAVLQGQQGTFVFVVERDDTVQPRTVEVDRERGNFSIIASGIEPGETVVTDGQLRLTPGARVEIEDAS
jgi:multidrug efflux system membrane fusion protein